MKFRDNLTGATLEVNNEIVIEQYKKHTDRYKEIKPEVKKTEAKK